METALLARDARASLEARDYPHAVEAYSRLLLKELSAPWEADPQVLAEWTEALGRAQEHHRWNPQGGWPAEEIVVAPGDSLIAVRKRFLAERPGALMCTGLIQRANGIRGHLQPGQELRIPTDPPSVLVDLGARWTLFLLGDEVAGSWPVGIGRPGEETPPGEYTVKDKLENPAWMKVGQEPIPFGDPRNPLGSRWVGWAAGSRTTSFGFHGTTEPESIGQASSDGCVRFRDADIEVLFEILPEGTPILVRD
jgi:hypothetical protein